MCLTSHPRDMSGHDRCRTTVGATMIDTGSTLREPRVATQRLRMELTISRVSATIHDGSSCRNAHLCYTVMIGV